MPRGKFITREKADAILASLDEGLCQDEVARRHGAGRQLVANIASGLWFEQERARQAKQKASIPRNGVLPPYRCPLCRGWVTTRPCHKCHVSAGARPSRYGDRSLHADVQADGRTRITRSVPDLDFHLLPEHEAVRAAIREGTFTGE